MKTTYAAASLDGGWLAIAGLVLAATLQAAGPRVLDVRNEIEAHPRRLKT